MINFIFTAISKKNYYKSLYIHFVLVIFIIIPLSYFIPQYLDSGTMVSKGEIKLITMSEDDYKKIISNTTKVAVTNPNANAQILNNDIKNLAFIKTVKKIVSVVNPPSPAKKENLKISINKVSRKIPLPISKPVKSYPNIKKNIQKDEKMSPQDEKKSSQDDIDNMIDATAIEQQSPPSSVEKNIEPEPDPINIISSDNPQTTIFGSQESIISEDLQISIKDIVAAQINKCWNEYYSQDADINDFVVTAVIGYAINGSVNKIDIESRLIIGDNKINSYNIMAQNAKKAIMKCSPIKGLPLSSYLEWKFIKINFRQGKNK